MFPFSVIIRFGSTTPSRLKSRVELNTVQAIKNCSDKFLMKQLFAKAGVASPKFYTSQEIVKAAVEFPIVKKLKFRSRGNGMVLVESRKQLDAILASTSNKAGIYFEEFFDSAREYRLHVSNLGCFYTCRKLRKKDAKERWYFNSRNSSWIIESNPLFEKPATWNEIVKECQKGLKALGMDFAAFDVRVTKKGKFSIIEANSAPSFGKTTLKKYLEHIPLLVKNKTKA